MPVELQTGHLKVIDGQKKRDAEDQVKTEKNQLKRPPSWLIDDVAKKEWRRVVKELSKLNIVGNLDLNNIGGYCNAFANYVKATEILSQQMYYVDRETRTGVIVVKNPMVDIEATIICERDSHKGIIIGKGGAMLKKIGSNARFELERMLDSKVNLKLWVKVKKDWRDSDFMIKNFGYDKKEI